MASSEEAVRLFRIRKTIMEMLKDRGYIVVDEDLAMNFKQFKEKFGDSIRRENLDFSKCKRDNPSDQICIFFPQEAKVGVGQIKPCFEKMKDANVHRGIVVATSLTPSAKKAIQDAVRIYRLEIFTEAELLVNISRHMLVPEHQLLTDAEKKSLLDRYHLKETQLPRIQLSDPIARYYGLQRGQVVKIIRPSETAGRYITYRFVI